MDVPESLWGLRVGTELEAALIDLGGAWGQGEELRGSIQTNQGLSAGCLSEPEPKRLIIICIKSPESDPGVQAASGKKACFPFPEREVVTCHRAAQEGPAMAHAKQVRKMTLDTHLMPPPPHHAHPSAEA
jgi:hypothetical protein